MEKGEARNQEGGKEQKEQNLKEQQNVKIRKVKEKVKILGKHLNEVESKGMEDVKILKSRGEDLNRKKGRKKEVEENRKVKEKVKIFRKDLSTINQKRRV